MKQTIIFILVISFLSCNSNENGTDFKSNYSSRLLNTCWASTGYSSYLENEVIFDDNIKDCVHLQFKEDSTASLSGWIMRCDFVKDGFIWGGDVHRIVEFSEERMKIARISTEGYINHYEIWTKIDCSIMNDFFKKNNKIFNNKKKN